MKKYRSFEDARKFAQSLELKSYKQWQKYCKDNTIPKDIPRAPDQKYKKEWISWGDFLGTNKIATNFRDYLKFEDARKFVKKLNISSANEWRAYCKSDNKPKNIPSVPYKTYKNKGWIGWGDWLGTKNMSGKDMSSQFLSYEDAREFVKKFDLDTGSDWKKFIQTNNIPDKIPRAPNLAYKNKWEGWQKFLGGTYREYSSYDIAKKFAQSLNLKTGREWKKFVQSKKKPKNIPANPNGVYKNKGWKGWGDFLGTGNIASMNKQFCSFEDAKKFAISLNFKNGEKWMEFCKLDKNPKNIPRNPNAVYKNKGWKGWGDFLGTGTISSIEKSKKYLPFTDAKTMVKELAKKYNIKNWKDWEIAYAEGKIPSNIPLHPEQAYSKKRTKK
ncbi:MAG: integrase repeat-containing protein [Candidatus Nitrosopumilus sp. bin_6a]